jgi:hypothetical protein
MVRLTPMHSQEDEETGTEARTRKAFNRIPEGSPRPEPPLRARYLLVSRNFPSGRDWRSRQNQTGDSQMTRTQKNQRPHGVFVVEGEGDKAFWTQDRRRMAAR